MIIHKLTEDIDRKESIEKITALKQYLQHHPNTVIVDSLEAVRKVISRARCCESLANVIKKLGPSCPFSQPGFFVVESEEESSAKNILCLMREKGIGFPVMCKPVEACGTPNSHRMVSTTMLSPLLSYQLLICMSICVYVTCTYVRTYILV